MPRGEHLKGRKMPGSGTKKGSQWEVTKAKHQLINWWTTGTMMEDIQAFRNRDIRAFCQTMFTLFPKDSNVNLDGKVVITWLE